MSTTTQRTEFIAPRAAGKIVSQMLSDARIDPSNRGASRFQARFRTWFLEVFAIKHPASHLMCSAFLAISFPLAACSRTPSMQHAPSGNAQNGAVVIVQYNCGSCHDIPGIQASDGTVGPSLAHFAQRKMIAGLLPNSPDRLVYWLMYPQSVVPGNAMPNMGLSKTQARDVAAYLETLS